MTADGAAAPARPAGVAGDAPALEGLGDAILSIASERALRPMLERVVEAARRLAGAKYAAVGLPDDADGFRRFVVAGISSKTWDAIGDLPRQHGLLGAMLRSPEPYRTPDIRRDPRFAGYPPAHPGMRSFLGVPIAAPDGRVLGAFYLTSKRRAPEFSAADQTAIETLAAHMAIAVENALLFERSRELSVMEERNRLARDLHDSVSQTLFSAVYTAEAVATLIDRDPARAKAQTRRLQEQARAAMAEMRSLIFELRPADLEADGLVPTIRKHVDVLRRVTGRQIEVRTDGDGGWPALAPSVERELFRIAQEAVNNALRHSGAGRIEVSVASTGGSAALRIRDDGRGFDAADRSVTSRRLGLTSMRERAEAVGGSLSIRSAPGAGTTVTVRVPAAVVARGADD